MVVDDANSSHSDRTWLTSILWNQLHSWVIGFSLFSLLQKFLFEFLFLFFFPEDYNQVYYLGFDRYNGERLYDDSSHNNNATLMNVQLDKEAGSCGKCAKICCGGQIIIDGSKFVGEL